MSSIRLSFYVVVALIALFPHSLSSQNWSGILDPTRATDWTVAGIPGGIPSETWTQAGSTISPCSGDCTVTIQTALNACGTNHYVKLGTGTFTLAGHLFVPANCELRGSGADQTILNAVGSGENHFGAIQMGYGGKEHSARYYWEPDWTTAINITGGTSQGSTSIVLDSLSGVTVGSFVIIDQLNDGTIVSNQGENGAGADGLCTWCGRANGTRVQGQMARVTSVDPSTKTVGIFPGLLAAYTLTPQATVVPMNLNSGIRDLQVYANFAGYADNFSMSACAFCWITGVEGNYADGDHVDLDYAYRSEVTNSYFSNAYLHSPGTFDSDLLLRWDSSFNLIQNNIFERLHASIMIEAGSSGNVIAYNLCNSEFGASSVYMPTSTTPTSSLDVAPTVVFASIDYHAGGPQYNLMEGNLTSSLGTDSTWGTNANNTYFRNWVRGTTEICTPSNAAFDSTGKQLVDYDNQVWVRRDTVSCTPHGYYGNGKDHGWFPFAGANGIEIDSLTSNANLVGNVVGSAEQESLVGSYGNGTFPIDVVPVAMYPTPRSWGNATYGYNLGYSGGTFDSSYLPVPGLSISTLFWHGDYNDLSKSIMQWTPGITHSLPASFYLPSRPSWWNASLSFPAIGPEVTSGPWASGHANLIPAENCYKNIMGGKSGAEGSPYIFNADACYKGASRTSLRNIQFSGMGFK